MTAILAERRELSWRPDDRIVSVSEGQGFTIVSLIGETTMAGLLFIVSRTKPGTYAYMRLVIESDDVVLFDRRQGDRRRVHQGVTSERRHGERRRRDVTRDLQKSGWAQVRRSRLVTESASR